MFVISMSFFNPTTISAIISIQPNAPGESNNNLNGSLPPLDIDCNSKNSGELLYLGKFNNDLQRYHAALDIFDNLLVRDPNMSEAIEGKGIALAGLGRYEEAIEHLDKALSLKSDPSLYTVIYNSKGVSLHGLGRYEEAIEQYDRGIEQYDLESSDRLPPFGYSDLFINKGVALSSLGRYEEAIEQYDIALALFQKDSQTALVTHRDDAVADTLYNKGNALSSLGRYEEAIEQYEKALDKASEKPRLPGEDVFQYCSSKVSEKIRTFPETTFEVRPELAPEISLQFHQFKKDPKLPYNLNRATSYLGGYIENLQYSVAAPKIEPKYVSVVKTILVDSLYRYDHSNDLYYIALPAISGNFDKVKAISLRISISLYETGDYQKAIVKFEEILNLDENNVDALHYISLCLEKIGDHDKAMEKKEKLKIINPDYKPQPPQDIVRLTAS